MLKYDIRPQVEGQNTIFGPSSNVKIGFRMSKNDIRPDFECKNRVFNVKRHAFSQKYFGLYTNHLRRTKHFVRDF